MKIYGITVLVLASITLVFGTISKMFEHSAGDNVLIASGILSIIGGAMLLSAKYTKMKAQ